MLSTAFFYFICMNNTIRLCIAGFTIELVADQPIMFSPASRLKAGIKLYAQKSPENDNIDLKVEVSRKFLTLLIMKKYLPRRNNIQYASDGRYHYVKTANLLLKLDAEIRYMAVAYTREQLQDDDIVAILRFGVEQLAIQAKALPVHCSAVAVNGNGYVFIGCSGAGKSTIANLMLTQCRLLNDEFNVIHMGNNVPTIYPTFFTDPETMEYASAEPAQCKELYFLEKGTDTSVHSMDYKSSLSALIQSAYVLPLDEFTTGKMLETIAVLHDKLSIKRLRFTNNVLTRQFLANLWGVG